MYIPNPKKILFPAMKLWSVIVCLAFSTPCLAQIQQAWAVHYNNGITNGQHQAIKMALGTDGYVYVCGLSENANSNQDYAVWKYAPNGKLLWVSRLDSTNVPQAKPTAFSLDASNNSVITGNAGTVKFDANGNKVWTVSYAGLTVATDSGSCAYVGGYSQDFGVTKLSPNGSNLWATSYVDAGGPTISQSVLVDSQTNIYVSGLDSYYNPSRGPPGPYVHLTTIKYDSSGRSVWTASNAPSPQNTKVTIQGAAIDSGNGICIAAYFENLDDIVVYDYGVDGNLAWDNNGPDPHVGIDTVHGLQFGSSNRLILAGQFAYFGPNYSYGVHAYGTYMADTNGSWLWTSFFPAVGPAPPSSALALALDSANNSYVTGYSPLWGTSNDIVTIAYDTNGKQLWLQRYDGPAHGDDEGNAIAVDTNGNVYVAGYETPIGGGTEMVLIKYSLVTARHEANGNFQLEAQGAANEPFDIRATTNLSTWQDLGLFDADTNGLLQFLDTNASQYNSRFYLAIPQ